MIFHLGNTRETRVISKLLKEFTNIAEHKIIIKEETALRKEGIGG